MNSAAPDPGLFRNWLGQCTRPIAIDLFSGAGGLSYGLESAGYRVALSVDLDEWARETHAHNFEGLSLGLDLASEASRASVAQLFQGVSVDLVAGGPPCQPFSRAGRSKIRSLVELGVRSEEDVRRNLWTAFLDVVDRIKPKAVLIENVPDMALGDDVVVLRHIMAHLESGGYEVDARIVDTWKYGVPQHRQRLIVVGLRDRSFVWPAAVEQATSLRDAIGDLPKIKVRADSELGSVELPYDGPMTDFQRRARKGCVGLASEIVHDHITRSVRADDLKAFRLMKPGTLYTDLPEELRRYRDDIFDDKYNRLNWEDFSRSITAHIAKDGYWYIHPEQPRTLTVREAARIQTFPDDFRFAGTRSHQFAQIGNAVPPLLGEVIGCSLLAASRDQPTSKRARPSSFRTAVREGLLGFGKEDAKTQPWSYSRDPWTVLVGLILGGKGNVDWPGPADALRLAPRWEAASEGVLAALVAMTVPGRRQMAAQRLADVAAMVRDDPAGWEGQRWQRLVSGPSDRRTMRALAYGEPLLLPTSASLRVTARLTETDVDQTNRLSAGRMELAKLLGGGSDSLTVNVAMHRLGTEICTKLNPSCERCPLNRICPTSTR